MTQPTIESIVAWKPNGPIEPVDVERMLLVYAKVFEGRFVRAISAPEWDAATVANLGMLANAYGWSGRMLGVLRQVDPPAAERMTAVVYEAINDGEALSNNVTDALAALGVDVEDVYTAIDAAMDETATARAALTREDPS